MNKSENKFTDKFALSSQNVHPRCELVVNQNASYALIYSNMSVNLRNKQGMMQSLQFNVTNSGFVRSLSAFYGLFIRLISEGSAFILKPNTDIINNMINNNLQF